MPCLRGSECAYGGWVQRQVCTATGVYEAAAPVPADEDGVSEEAPPGWTVVWWHGQARCLSLELREGWTLLSSLAFLFAFVQEKAKAISIGRTESHVPTAWGPGTPGLGLPSRWILLPGMSRNQCKPKKAWASKAVLLLPCDLLHRGYHTPKDSTSLHRNPLVKYGKGD